MRPHTIHASILVCSLLVLALVMGCQAPEAEVHEHEHHEHGKVDFSITGNAEAQRKFEAGLTMLHHMMYEQARAHFKAAAEADPDCAMAHWGIAMASFQPLWHPTDDAGLQRGKAAVETARQIGAPTQRERDYIAAVETFFTDPDPPRADRPSDHEARVKAWKQAQRELHEAYPEDVDAAAFYALAEVCYAMTQFSPDEPRDFTRERRAGALLEGYLDDHPEHPGLFHYIIHAYDSTELAPRAEEVASEYDQLAPEVPHALHMPSHIFVRLGNWEQTAEWNERSAEAALRYPVNGKTSLHYPHALDYMMYAYLQLDRPEQAKRTLEHVEALERVEPSYASAYGMAAARARYYLEQQKWAEAAELEPGVPDALAWENYPGAEALIHYARGLGASRSGDLDAADAEREKIEAAAQALRDEGDAYWAIMTEALAGAVDAWVLYERGRTQEAIDRMAESAELEESMDKHPITPGEILPVRELHAELLLRDGLEAEAIEAFETSLERTPKRRNALAGIERAKASIGDE